MKKFPILQRLKELTTKIGNVGNTDLQTQVTTLNSNLTPVVGDLTDVVTPSRRDMAKYSVSGNMCTIFLNNVAFSDSFSSDTPVFNCPYKPVVSTRFIMYDQDINVIPCWVNGTTGNVTINGYTGGKLLYGSVTFVCVRN